MEVLVKGIVIGTAVVVAAVTMAIEWWRWKNVPEPYPAYGQRRLRNN